MEEDRDRGHLANKVGKDAISTALKEFEMNFPLEHGGEGSLPIKPLRYDDSWVEHLYDAMGEPYTRRIVIRLKILTYKKINTCHPGITYYNNGYVTHCIACLINEKDLVAHTYSNIKKTTTSLIKEHSLYQPVKNKLAKKIKKVSEDSNLLLLL